MDDVRKSLMTNLLSSPFVNPTVDGTGSKLSEMPMWYIRQLREPVRDANAVSCAAMFDEMLRGAGPGENAAWRHERLCQYEQYFARIELLDRSIVHEATVRQLVRAHLLSRVPRDALDKHHLLKDRKITVRAVTVT